MALDGFLPEAADRPPLLHLVEELNHRIVNEYTEAALCLSLVASRTPNPRGRNALAAASERLLAHAATYRALLQPAAAGLVDLTTYVGRICLSLSNALLSDSLIRLRIEASDDAWLRADRAWRAGLIVADLVRNAARHGLAGGSGEIIVRLSANAGQVSCVVQDNGQAGPSAAPGRGRRVIGALAAKLGGSASWQFTPSGCVIRLQFPIDPPR